MYLLFAAVGLAVGVFVGLTVGGSALRQRLARIRVSASGRAADLLRIAASDAELHRKDAEVAAKEEVHRARVEAEAILASELRKLDGRRDQLGTAERRVEELARVVGERAEAVSKRDNDVRSRDGDARAQEREAARLGGESRGVLERVAGERADDVKRRLVEQLLEEVRAHAASVVRAVDVNAQGPEVVRDSKRLMDLAMQRYDGHFLTERLVSTMPLPVPILERMAGTDNERFGVLEAATGIKLLISEHHDSIRLDGQDGIGREIVRRVIRRWEKEPRLLDKDTSSLAQQTREKLDREIVEFGRRAFTEMRIPKPHPEIVELVGKLNWRTSYTQNQWKHACEAAILCGIIAEEMGLDASLAKRAALMHDIGKSLTHAIDGSHAVIGADIARRLGEDERVANAIGAHHLDEPFQSAYAEIVAACDALSGARPGARRESAMVESYGKRLMELERIAGSLRGVDSVHPVQGGREVRVYVQEGRVSDERCVEMCGELAKRISDEMVFPGQIKVTVIREFRAVEVAS